MLSLEMRSETAIVILLQFKPIFAIFACELSESAKVM